MSLRGSDSVYEINDKFAIAINNFLNSDADNFFNKDIFFKHYSKNNKAFYFQLIRKSDSFVYATLTFYEKETTSLFSPLYGTFGGVSARESINFDLLEIFINTVISKILSSYNHFIIKLNPLAYSSRVCSKSFNILSRIGFQVLSSDLNYSLEVGSSYNYREGLSSGNKKKLNQCVRDGLYVKRLKEVDYVKAYDIILQNRLSKNYPISVTKNQFKEMISVFAEDIFCFGVFRQDSKDLIASSVCIKVSNEVLYVFYWGDIPLVSTHSPIIILSHFLYEFCLENKFKILDIGTSTLDGEPNYGLVKFKENIGFKESLKFTMELKKI